MIDAGDLDLQRSLTELVGLLPAGETFEDTLRRIVVLACQTVEGCESASVTLLGTSDGPSTVVHTDDLALRLDELQYENGTGPCLQAARDGETPVAVRSMEAETRWGAYPARAFALGARSSYSVPLAVQARPTGALNLYSKKVDAFTAASHHTGALFGGQAAVAIANAQVYDASRRLVAQMEDALRSRAVIEQAKGILMAERAVDANAAFDLLRAASQRENVKLRDIAQRLVDSK